MLTPPPDLAEADLVTRLADVWGLTAVSLEYRPVGWGSHHWSVLDAAGRRWFATVDDLVTKRHHARESLVTAFDRLRASLAAAVALREHGHGYAVAPVLTPGAQSAARLGRRFALALYPFIDGESFGWGPFPTPEHRRAILDLIIALHRAPDAVRRLAPADEFEIPHRDALELSLASTANADVGPYARPAARLLAGHADAVRRLIERYDDLVAACRDEPARAVLTHGEPHPGNTMRTGEGYLLIDWDTALRAPPERDLWSLGRDDPTIIDIYAEAAGLAPRPPAMELYRVRWDLADIAVDVDRFRRPHRGSADDDESFALLRANVERA